MDQILKISAGLILLFAMSCSSVPRRLASDSGTNGAIGACGIPAADGTAGQINADTLYPNFPLCNVASIITSANDTKKLSEFLRAGCRIDVPAKPGSESPLWDLSVAKQRIDLIKILLSDANAAKQANLYQPIDTKALNKSDFLIPLNPFEVAVLGNTLKKIKREEAPEALKQLHVGGQQVAMLNLLLAASSDRKTLESAIQRVVYYLNASLDASSCNQAAAEAINNRLNELSK